ncbi:hypothetical protein OIU85_008342, partial [Salix viminalis]
VVSGLFEWGEGETLSIILRQAIPLEECGEFRLCTRNHVHEKPVIRGEWLNYVREKGLTVNDFIILTKVEDAEHGVSYNIRVQPNSELAL